MNNYKNKFKEIFILKQMLDATDIPHNFLIAPCGNGYQIVYTFDGEKIADAIETDYSYGHEDDLLEIGGAPNLIKFNDSNEAIWQTEECDDVEGHLDAQTVYNKFATDYTTRIAMKQNEEDDDK